MSKLQVSKTAFVDIDHPTKQSEKVRVEVQSLPLDTFFAIVGEALTWRMLKDDKDPNDAEERTKYLQSVKEGTVTDMYNEDIKAMQRLICRMVLPPLRLSTLPQSKCQLGVVSVDKISTEDQFRIFNSGYSISVAVASTNPTS